MYPILSYQCFFVFVANVVAASTGGGACVAAGVVVAAIGAHTSVVVAAGVGAGGVNTGVVTVHRLHVVTVSVVKNVDVLVTTSTDVFPFLVCVFVLTGQEVTVV